jgi:hypothetical protein
MLLEKCLGREVGDCTRCGEGTNRLTDRRGESFPALRLPGSHRNIVYNSHATVMSDRRRELCGAGLEHGHFLFSTETPREVDAVLKAYQSGAPLLDNKIRRM